MHQRVVCLGCGGSVEDGLQPLLADDEPCTCPPPPPRPAVLACPQCGGALQPGAHACRFCASTVATERCGECLCWNLSGDAFCSRCGEELSSTSADRDESSLKCPSCGDPLQQRSYARAELDECDGCGGVYIEAAMMDRLMASQTAPTGLRLALPQPKAGAASAPRAQAYLKCPVCQVVTNRTNFGRISGIVVDVCRGHGVWFDAGEIADVLAFVERGGLSNPRARQQGFAVAEGVPAGSFVNPDELQSYDAVPKLFAEALSVLWESVRSRRGS